MDSKNYLIVGGTRGIGSFIAKKLSEEGHNVFSLSRTEGDTSQNITYLQGDATNSLDILSELPDSIDGIAYCPGSINLKPFRSLKIDDFQSDFEVNVLGAIKVLQANFKRLRKSESPAVLLFSTVAVGQGMAYHASVAAAKGAVEGLTRSLAAEWAPKIRVNCIAPSLTDTSLAERLLSSLEKREAGANRHPLKKIGSPENLAELATFLLSEKSNWITGQVIGADGGLSTLRV